MTNSVTSPVQKKVVGIHQLFITIVFKSHIISNWGGANFTFQEVQFRLKEAANRPFQLLVAVLVEALLHLGHRAAPQTYAILVMAQDFRFKCLI